MPEDLPFNPAEVAERLFAWYGKSGRDLPWRKTRDPYRIWVSEIMLQQTTVTAVIPYYTAFLRRFPDVGSLAAAPVEAVIEQWSGLGYYRRARNLHAAAMAVIEQWSGAFPADLEALQSLPGIGRSTAGAILSIAFDQPAPILDGNVRRVLCRLFALQEPSRGGAAERQLWSWAEQLTPADRPHDHAQAIMDLGATVCLPKLPRCAECPLEPLCQARRRGLENRLPVVATKKPLPTQRQVALAIRNQDRWLTRRRPLDGMLGGLWEFPTAEVPADWTPEFSARRLAADLGVELTDMAVGEVRHGYSHFHLELTLFVADQLHERVAEGAESRWLNISELPSLPLHGAHKKLVSLLAKHDEAGTASARSKIAY